jgi:transposase InsO family protein
MKLKTPMLTGSFRLARTREVSKQARQRLKWIDYYMSHGNNARLTCRHFDVSPQTFYRWKRRYNPKDLKSLEDRSRRPRHVRQPTASIGLLEAVLGKREAHPRWGKEKIAKLLNEDGWQVSVSMVGRIIKRLKDRGLLKEPIWNSVSVRKRQQQRPYATRKPKWYEPKEPGDIVQLDTMDVRPLPGVVVKHFTARDVISRWDVLEAHTRASSSVATAFMHTLLARMPFPIRAIQVDGGSEFMADFERECQRLGVKLFVLPPNSPKLNGHVERAHRSHTEEFYELTNSGFEIAELNQALFEWEKVYNTVRPHQSLGYLTPQKFLERFKATQRKGLMCH